MSFWEGIDIDGLDIGNMDINRKQSIWKEPNEAIANEENVDYKSVLTYKAQKEAEALQRKQDLKSTILIGVLLVGGYFAYKKFKK
jgi:hypothetical protein